MTNIGKLVKSNKCGFDMMQIQSSIALNVKLIEIKSLEVYELEYLNQIISLSVTCYLGHKQKTNKLCVSSYYSFTFFC